MPGRTKPVLWDDLPLYATDTEIGEALLGKADAWKWGQIMVPALEKRGLPRLNAYVCPAAIRVRLRVNQDETRRCAVP